VRWKCQSQLGFFGLNNEYIEAVYEELFTLKHHGGWSFYEAYNLPIQIRRWFIRRLVKFHEDEQAHHEKEIQKAKRK
jgi:hypothetical protein